MPGYVMLALSGTLLAGCLFAPRIMGTLIGGNSTEAAFGFLLLAASLVLLDEPDRLRWITSRVLALAAVLFGLLNNIEFYTAWHAGLSRVVPIARRLHVGTLPPVTALNLTLVGVAILTIDVVWRGVPLSQLFVWMTAAISFLTLTACAYDPASLSQLAAFAGVSISASLAFLLLGTAILLARPQYGVGAILLSRNLGGTTARRMLPAAIFLPFTVSLLILHMHYAGAYGAALMIFLFVVAPVMVFVPLVLLSASLLNRMEAERLRSERELRISTERLASVVGSAMDAIITLDEQQRVVVFNAAAEKMFGCPGWEALGKTLDRFLPAGLGAMHRHSIDQFGSDGVTTRSMHAPGALTAVRVNGERFPIEATISQVQVAGQKLYTAILRDITQRKRDEETLRHSEERFRSIYEQAAVGIKQVGHDGRILMANAALCRMLGYQESELRGRGWAEITHPEDIAGEAVLLEAMRQRQRNSYEIEKRYLHKSGASVWVNVTSSLVRDEASEPLYRLTVIQDITERKRAEEQLKQAQKMEAIGRLAGGVAHDFNTLLNVMLGYSELLIDELALGDPRRERVQEIKNSAESAAVLTRQLLAFSRKQPVVQEVLDLRDAVARMAPMVSRLLRNDIELVLRCGDEPCPVKVDPGQIQQLVLNLVANAGDAMPEGGEIRLEVNCINLDQAYVQQHPTLKTGAHAVLAIHDSGTGMSPETVAHIFEPFFTTKAAGKGTGLGLATVYGIARSNGGDIWVYSEQGVGTVFKIFLPLTTDAVRSPAMPRETASVDGGGGETILLVEDSSALRELTRVILTRNGYRVLVAEDGLAALDVAAAHRGELHLLLTDVVMPRMRGPELAERLLQERPNLGVVFLSGYAEEALGRMKGHRRLLIVEKPYTAESLLSAVRRALDVPRANSGVL